MLKMPSVAANRAPGVFASLGYILLYILSGPVLLLLPLFAIKMLSPELFSSFKSSLSPGSIAIGLQAIGALFIALFLHRSARMRHWSAQDLGFRKVPLRTILKYVALYPVYFVGIAVLAGIAITAVVSLTGWNPTPGADADTSQRRAFITGLGIQYALVAVVLLAPVVEEILFRGLLFRSLRQRMGFGPSTAITSVLFGVVHFNPLQAVWAALMSPYLCWIRERTGSIYPSMAVHALWNGFVLLVVFNGLGA